MHALHKQHLSPSDQRAPPLLPRPGGKAVTASVALSRALQDPGRSCCRSSGWMRWWSTTRMLAAVAASCCGEMIQSPCAIR